MSESRFEDKLCPICRKRFTADDEVVVCPECGTPHHRACWNKLNRCGVEEYHGMNYVWNGRLPDEEEPIKSEPETEQPDDPHHAEYPNIMPDQELLEQMDYDPMIAELVKKIQSNEKGADGVSMRELAAFTANSVWHYSRAFGMFRSDGGRKHRVFFNFCSGLFAPIFQFYRKMDIFGILAAIVMLVPTVIIAKLSGGTESQISDGVIYLLYFINITMSILLCLFNDYIYYKHAVKRILKIRESYEGDTESDDYFMTLYQSGKPSLARAALGVLGVMLLEACVKLVL